MGITDGDVARAAAEAGADVVRRHYRTEVERHLKVGSDFATDADLEAESVIRAVLTEHRPDDAQLGEEHGASGPSEDVRTRRSRGGTTRARPQRARSQGVCDQPTGGQQGKSKKGHGPPLITGASRDPISLQGPNGHAALPARTT